VRSQDDADRWEAAVDAAASLSGVICRLSAASYWGWSLKSQPDRPQITLPKHRRPGFERREGVEIRWLDLPRRDIHRGLVTTPSRTLVDCLRRYPFDAGLCIADSALRNGFPQGLLDQLAREARGPGAARVKIVAKHADGRAANAFESVLRAICLGVDGLSVEPQVSVGSGSFLGRPDLVDRRLGLVIEADSFEFHGTRKALHADMRRYNAFVLDGWTVLRFAWEDVMFRPDIVRSQLQAAVVDRLRQLGLER
jgi:very-short-patch-repair endonuclease